MKRVHFLAAIAVAMLTVASSSAEAKRHHHYRHHAHRVHVANTTPQTCYDTRFSCPEPVTRTTRVNVETADEGRVVGGRPSGCPHAFCGCGTALHIFGRIIPELNLAANWRKFPSAQCAAGNAAWRWGHVFAIESCNGDGTAVAFDSNSGGHQTRVHTVSLRGYHVVNPQGSRQASISE